MVAGPALKSGNTKSCGCLFLSSRIDFDINMSILERMDSWYQKRDISENNRLGQLCFRGHDWRGTGQSLRNKKECLFCFRLRTMKHSERRELQILNTDNGTVTETELYFLKRKYANCPYCGIELRDGDRHLDHIIPLSKGGRHVINNVLYCCADCNMRKTNRDFEDWIKTLKPKYSKRAIRIWANRGQYQRALPLLFS